MRIFEAIEKIDSLMFNTYTVEDKVAWLSKLDALVKRHIIDTHEGTSQVAFGGYTEETDRETVLLVPAPYDEMYIRWLEAQIHYTNGEYGKYNNAILMFNTEYEAFASYYNRTYMPVRRGKRFLF